MYIPVYPRIECTHSIQTLFEMSVHVSMSNTVLTDWTHHVHHHTTRAYIHNHLCTQFCTRRLHEEGEMNDGKKTDII